MKKGDMSHEEVSKALNFMMHGGVASKEVPFDLADGEYVVLAGRDNFGKFHDECYRIENRGGWICVEDVPASYRFRLHKVGRAAGKGNFDYGFYPCDEEYETWDGECYEEDKDMEDGDCEGKAS